MSARRPRPRRAGSSRHVALGIVAGALVAAALPIVLSTAAQAADDTDPRIDLAPGLDPWSDASSNIELLDNDRLTGAFEGKTNSDLAFTGTHAISGSYNGFQVYDISDPSDPTLSGSFVCPGGQGDVSVHGDLLFMSVEQSSGRTDCGTQGTQPGVDPARFRGIRIFDISDLSSPVQVGGVQTCRGSHTHTIVTDPDDAATIYLYNSGTAGVRAAEELAGCENAPVDSNDPVTTGNPTQWRIDVIKVPLAAPETAAIVSQPRIFTDPATGAYNGLQNLPTQPQHPSGTDYAPSPNTNTCHDITAFPAIGLAAGACQGNGILLDISDPANPVRTDAVADANFSYWHSATINNDGTKVVFTDEWGGGSGARCRDTDEPEWGADAIFDIVDGKLQFRSYYKLPVPQTETENCVAHNGSLIPVPGRDIMVQAWYQGGLSVFDFTDSRNPVEIAYYDRGPISGTGLVTGGYWSTYWYNGHVYGNEIARGFDALALQPSDLMSADEIAAASAARVGELNAQHQQPLTWKPSFAVTGARLDQAVRSGALSGDPQASVTASLARARQLSAQDATSAPLVRHHLGTALTMLGTNGQQGALRRSIVELRDSVACTGECKLPTSTSASHRPAAAGRPTSVQVDVTRVGTEGLDPTGAVVVTDKAGKELGRAPLVKGSTLVPLPATLPGGSHTLTATYVGDDTHARSSGSFTAAIEGSAAARSRTTLTVKPGKPKVRSSFRVVAKVRATGADVRGTAVLRIDGTKVAAKRVKNGRVVFTVTKRLGLGKHRAVVSYEGSATVLSSRASTTFRVVR
jgi:hypothetical protein